MAASRTEALASRTEALASARRHAPGDALRHAARSLARHRLRAALGTLGIVCGVVSFVVMIALSEGAKRETLAQMEQLGLRNVIVKALPMSAEQEARAGRLGSRGVSESDAARLREAVPGVRRVAELREVAATVVHARAEAAPQVIAVTPEYVELQRLEVAAGRFVAPDDVRQRARVCVLGQEVARALGEAGRPGATLRIENSLFRVVGVLARIERRTPRNSAIAVRDFDNVVLVPLGSDAAFAPLDERLTELVAEVGAREDVLAALPVIRRTLDLAHRGADDYRIVAPQELLRQANQARENFDWLIAGLSAVCLLAGGIGIMNIMLAIVTERTAEIGIRRAVGATREDIATQFLAEATLLTAAGGVAGVILGAALALALAFALGWPVAITPWAVGLPLAAAVGAGLFFGLYPAVLAARLDPIAALRHG